MKALPNERHISFWLFILAPLTAMTLPLILMLIDEQSQCHLIPLIKKKQQFPPEYLINIYFGIPLVIGFYGIYLVFKNRHLRMAAVRKFYTLCGLVLLNLLSPILLIVWGYVILIIWLSSGCYKLELRLF